jgi:hypothetical protein
MRISLCYDWGRWIFENREVITHSIFFGLMTKHHLIQIEPVAIKAMFCVIESFSAGRTKSDAPAMTTPHFMTGAL